MKNFVMMYYLVIIEVVVMVGPLIFLITQSLKKRKQALRFELEYKHIFKQNDILLLMLDPFNGKPINLNGTVCKHYGYSLLTVQLKRSVPLSVNSSEKKIR